MESGDHVPWNVEGLAASGCILCSLGGGAHDMYLPWKLLSLHWLWKSLSLVGASGPGARWKLLQLSSAVLAIFVCYAPSAAPFLAALPDISNYNP